MYDFELRATSEDGEPQPLVVSMVRVVKVGGDLSMSDCAGQFACGVDMVGVIVLFVIAAIVLALLVVVVARSKRTRCSCSGARPRSRARTGATMTRRGAEEFEVRAVRMRDEAPAWPPAAGERL